MQYGTVMHYACMWTMLCLPVLGAAQKTVRWATAADVVTKAMHQKPDKARCRNIENYVPDTLRPYLSPMRYLRINVHIIQDGKGRHNFSEQEGRAWVKELITQANNRLAANQKLWLPPGNNYPAYPIPLRYQLTGRSYVAGDDGIYFHRDDSLFFVNKKARGKNVNNIYDERQFQKYGIQKDTVINVFLLEHHPDSTASPTYRATHDGIGRPTYAKLVGQYYLLHRATGPHRFDAWQAAGLFNHELGHTLGLSHTWNMDDGCDDTPKHAGCWNFNEPEGCVEVSNNVMDYNAYQSAYSPCQIAKMMLACFDDKGIRRFLIPTWCQYQPEQTVVISSGEKEEWNRAVDLSGDLILHDRSVLTIRCTVCLPPGARVVLKKRATLILDGGQLTSRCSEPFEGIQLHYKGKKIPRIIIQSKGSVTHVRHPL